MLRLWIGVDCGVVCELVLKGGQVEVCCHCWKDGLLQVVWIQK